MIYGLIVIIVWLGWIFGLVGFFYPFFATILYIIFDVMKYLKENE